MSLIWQSPVTKFILHYFYKKNNIANNIYILLLGWLHASYIHFIYFIFTITAVSGWISWCGILDEAGLRACNGIAVGTTINKGIFRISSVSRLFIWFFLSRTCLFLKWKLKALWWRVFRFSCGGVKFANNDLYQKKIRL